MSQSSSPGAVAQSEVPCGEPRPDRALSFKVVEEETGELEYRVPDLAAIPVDAAAVSRAVEELLAFRLVMYGTSEIPCAEDIEPNDLELAERARAVGCAAAGDPWGNINGAGPLTNMPAVRAICDRWADAFESLEQKCARLENELAEIRGNRESGEPPKKRAHSEFNPFLLRSRGEGGGPEDISEEICHTF